LATITPSRWFVLALSLLGGLAAIAVDLSLPAIPGTVAALDAPMSAGQQIVGYYIAGIALGQLPAGLVSDRIGRLPVIYAGMTVFTVAAIVATLATSIEVLLLARFVQGLGASAGIVLSRAIVRDITSGAEAARLLSLMVMIFTVAPMLAPMFGSLLVTTLGWRSSFAAVAVLGLAAILLLQRALFETHTPSPQPGIFRQLAASLREFASHRMSLLGALMVMLAAAGYMSMISGSAALIIEIYRFPTGYFGFVFALQGAGLLIGSSLNRRLLLRYSSLRLLGLGAALASAAAVQMLLIAWLGTAPFWWVWANACLFMFGSAFIMTNGTAIALDPVPRIAGVGSSLIGTFQGLAASASAMLASALYDGSVVGSILILGGAGIALVLVYTAMATLSRSRS